MVKFILDPFWKITDLSPGTGTAIFDRIACSHRAAYYQAIADQSYTTSVCQVIGYICSSHARFNVGLCADCGNNNMGCKPMPFNVDFYDNNDGCSRTSINVRYFCNTGSVLIPGTTTFSNTYCLYHYQIIVMFWLSKIILFNWFLFSSYLLEILLDVWVSRLLFCKMASELS